MAKKPVFYLCEICGAHHPWNWNGDCRENNARYSYEKLDKQFGCDGWEERSMSDRVAADGF